ncbi:hypothetical protein SOVF_171590 [Spinacia oleracea]|nr:hypothetical protein SOVF_171590 [Spinacia oleracea]
MDDAIIDPKSPALTTSVPIISSESPSFNAQDMIAMADRQAASFMISSVKDKLLNSPLAKVHELAQEFEHIFSYIREKKIDISATETFIKGYIGCGTQLHNVQLGKKGNTTLNDLEQQSSEIESSLKEAAIIGQKKEEQMKSLHMEIDQLQQERAEYRKKLDELAEKEDILLPLITNSEEQFQEFLAQKNEREKSLLALKESTVVAKEVEAKLAEAEKQFGVARDDLQAFKFEL